MSSARLRVVGTTQLIVEPVTHHGTTHSNSTQHQTNAPQTTSGIVVPLSRTQRKLLATLALFDPEPVLIDDLTEIVWDGTPPSTARTALHNQISRIRQRVDIPVVTTTDTGYQLAIRTDIADLGRQHTRSLEMFQAGRYESLIGFLNPILQTTGALPFEDLADSSLVTMGRARIEELYYAMENLRLQAARELGWVDWVVPEAYRLALAARHDERRWKMVIESLTDAGRRGDALAAFEQARRMLAEELGIELGEHLREAEREILGAIDNRLRRNLRTTAEHNDLIAQAIDYVNAGYWVEIVGEAGSGKSPLILRIANAMRSTNVRKVMIAIPRYASNALSPLLDIVEELDIDPATLTIPLPGFVVALQDDVRARGPLVLLVDDLNLAGPTVHDALIQASRIPGVSVVVTTPDPIRADVDSTVSPEGEEIIGRAHEVANNDRVVALPIALLTREQVGELCQRFLDSGLGNDPDLQTWLWQMSGGNPAFLEYLLSDSSFPEWWANRHGDEVLPPVTGLRDLVRTQLGQLGRQAIDVLQLVAVAGAVLSIDEVTALLGRDGLPLVLETGWLTAVTPESARQQSPLLAFRHGAVKRIIYDDIPAGQQQELHLIVSNTLRLRGDSPESYAAHAVAAHNLDPQGAYFGTMAAGDKAFRDAAYADAATWYDKAIATAPTVDGRDRGPNFVAAIVQRAECARCLGHDDQIERLFDAIDRSLEIMDPELIANAVFSALQLGSTTDSGVVHQRTADAANAALKVLPVGDHRGIILGSSSLILSLTDEAEQMRERMLDAIEMTTSDEVRGSLLPFCYMSLGHPKDLGLRLRHTTELLEISQRLASPIVRFEALHLAFSNSIMTADGAQLRSTMHQLEDTFPFVGDIGRHWSLIYQRAALAHIDGRLEDAESLADEAFALFSPVLFSRAMAAYGGQILAIRIAQNRVGELTDVIANLVDEQPDVGAWNGAYALAIATDDPERAVEYSRKARTSTLVDFTWLASHLVAARAAAITADVELCATFMSDLLPWSGLVCWQGTCSFGPVDTILGQLAKVLGNDKDAAKYRRQALRQADSLASVTFWDEALAL